MQRLHRAARPTGVATVILVWSAAWARPAAADVYYWNATGTDWTSPNAWNLNAVPPNGPQVTWVNGNDAFFTAGGSVAVSTSISAASLVFNYPSQVTVTAAGGSLTVTGLTGAGTITMGSTAGATINAPLGGGAYTVFRNTPSGTESILTLGGTNTFTGPLTIGGGGTVTTEINFLAITSTTAIPSAAEIRFDARNAALAFGSGLPAAFTLPNNIVLNRSNAAGSLPNYIRSATLTDATFSGLISGSGGLTLGPASGSAAWGTVVRLTNANTYAGNTTVQDGFTLLVNNPVPAAGSATGVGGVITSGGAAAVGRVGGIGRIGGVDPVTGDGLRLAGSGHLAPGDPALNNGVGQLQATSRINLIAGSTFEVQLGGVNDSDSHRDQIRSNSTINFDVANANVKLDVAKVGSFSFTPGQVYTYRVAQADAGITMPAGAGGQFDASKITVTSSFGSTTDFALSYLDLGGTDHYLVLTYTAPVPEPAFVLAGCAAVAAAAGRGALRPRGRSPGRNIGRPA
jgi:autotransporter-associated beta strand protein